MAFYECTFIARPDITPQDVEKLADKYSNIVDTAGGRIVKREYWGLRNMAYKINKQKKGHYMMLGVESPAAGVTEMRRNFELDEDIMRNLVVRVEALSEEASPIYKSSQYSEEAA